MPEWPGEERQAAELPPPSAEPTAAEPTVARYSVPPSCNKVRVVVGGFPCAAAPAAGGGS